VESTITGKESARFDHKVIINICKCF